MTAFLRYFQDLYFAVFCVATQCGVAGGYQHFLETCRFCFQSRRLRSSTVSTRSSEACVTTVPLSDMC